MSWEYEYMHDFGRSDVVTSSYWHLNFKKKMIDDVMISFVQLKLSRLVVVNFLPNFDML